MKRPEAGWIYFEKRRMNRLDFLHRLSSAKSRYEKITLIPGETTAIFLPYLAKKLGLDTKKLYEEYRKRSPYKEAGIVAESYNIPLHYDEKRVMSYLLNLTDSRYRKIARRNGIEYDPARWRRILTIASIIQKEAAGRSEMALISSVIHNRLKKGMRLQMDGTLNYGRYSHIRVTPERIRNDKTTFNTYRHAGLPKYPVCNVSESAIEAAINPADTDYLYFMKNGQGRHDFTSSYRKHLKNIRKKRRKKLKTEDSE